MTLTTAMVLAAGHGTRMYPLTQNRSKAMVEVDGKPLIEHMLLRLEAAGIERIVVNVHAHADHLEGYVRARRSKAQILISDEREELLETGGGVVKALALLERAGESAASGKNDAVLICNIDAIWQERTDQLKALLLAWSGEYMDDLLLITPNSYAFGYAGQGDFVRGSDGRMTRYKPHMNLYDSHVYAGVQIAKLAPLKAFKPVPFSRNRVWDISLKAGRLYGHVLDGHWLHVGDPQAKDLAEEIIKLGRSPYV